MYEDWNGNIYEDEQEAFDQARDEMEWEDYADYMRASVSWDKLFEFARTQESFFDHFQDELLAAEEQYFEEHYTPVDEED